jgi:lysozyme family protein
MPIKPDPAVAELQRALRRFVTVSGDRAFTVAVDGKAGPRTMAAVQRFARYSALRPPAVKTVMDVVRNANILRGLVLTEIDRRRQAAAPPQFDPDAPLPTTAQETVSPDEILDPASEEAVAEEVASEEVVSDEVLDPFAGFGASELSTGAKVAVGATIAVLLGAAGFGAWKAWQ